MKYLRNAVVAVCAAAMVPAFATATAGATTAPKTVPVVADATIIQGLPKTSVDVYVNGTDIVQDFRFKGVVGPIPLRGATTSRSGCTAQSPDHRRCSRRPACWSGARTSRSWLT